MKCLLSIVVILLFTLTAKSQQTQSNFLFNTEFHNFGTIKKHAGRVNYKFEFKNIGSKPLVIHKVNANNECITLDWTHQPIVPKMQGYVSVTFNPKNYDDRIFNEIVTLISLLQ